MKVAKRITVGIAGVGLGLAMLLVVPQVAHADAYGDLVKISTAFQNAKSWHAEEDFSNGRTNLVDYVAPDRWRLEENAKSEELIIGKDVYTVENGKASRMPFGGGLIRRIIQKTWNQEINSDTVRESARDLGMQMLDGRSVHAYSFTAHNTPVTIYVGSDWLPIETVVHSKKPTTVKYSKYNEPISIDVP